MSYVGGYVIADFSNVKFEIIDEEYIAYIDETLLSKLVQKDKPVFIKNFLIDGIVNLDGYAIRVSDARGALGYVLANQFAIDIDVNYKVIRFKFTN